MTYISKVHYSYDPPEEISRRIEPFDDKMSEQINKSLFL
jgi:hypothetical protein